MLELPPMQAPVQAPLDARHATERSVSTVIMLAVISWWLVIQLFALAALPLAWRLFARLPGRGYPFAKALGLLLVSYVLWLGATLHLLPNAVGGAVVALLVVAGVSWWLGRDGWQRDAAGERPLLAWLHANRVW